MTHEIIITIYLVVAALIPLILCLLGSRGEDIEYAVTLGIFWPVAILCLFFYGVATVSWWLITLPFNLLAKLIDKREALTHE